jgi:hypothetical protein
LKLELAPDEFYGIAIVTLEGTAEDSTREFKL